MNSIEKVEKVKRLREEYDDKNFDVDFYYEHIGPVYTKERYCELRDELSEIRKDLNAALNNLTPAEMLAAGNSASISDILEESENEFNKDIKAKIALAMNMIHEPRDLAMTHTAAEAAGKVDPDTGIFKLQSVELYQAPNKYYVVDFGDATVRYEDLDRDYTLKWDVPELRSLSDGIEAPDLADTEDSTEDVDIGDDE